MGHYRSVSLAAPIAGLIALFAGAPVFASTLVSITGGGSFIEYGDTDDWGAQAWTQTGSYTDVTIRATFGDAVYQGDGSAFLEEKVGNHAVVIDSVDFVIPQDPKEIKLFTGLSLGPGTYYLAAYGDGAWICDPIEADPVITTAPDVSNVTDTLVSTDDGHTSFDSNNEISQEFQVTGTEVSVNGSAPEPFTAVLLGSALFLGAALKRLAGKSVWFWFYQGEKIK